MVKPLVCYVLLRGDRLNILQGLLHEIAHHGVHAAGLLVDGDLAIGARATGVLQQGTQVVNLAAAAQVINYVIDEVQQFADRVTHAETALPHEIDLRGIQAIAHCAPLVFIDEIARQHVGAHAALVQPGQHGDEGLAERCNGERIFHADRYVADTKFDGLEERMRAYIPPDLFAVIDAASPDEGLHIVVEFAPRCQGVGHAIARERLPDDGAIGFHAGKAPIPEWRVRGDGKQMWEPGTKLVDEHDSHFITLDMNMDVQGKDQDGAHNIL